MHTWAFYLRASGYTGSPLRDDYAELFYIPASSSPRTPPTILPFTICTRVLIRVFVLACINYPPAQLFIRLHRVSRYHRSGRVMWHRVIASRNIVDKTVFRKIFIIHAKRSFILFVIELKQIGDIKEAHRRKSQCLRKGIENQHAAELEVLDVRKCLLLSHLSFSEYLYL